MLIIALIVSVIYIMILRSSRSDFHTDLLRKLGRFASMSSLMNSDRQSTILKLVGEQNSEYEKMKKNSQEITLRNENLLKCINEKDELFENLKNKSDESVSKITSLYSDFLLLQYDISVKYLSTKSRPAYTEAKRIAELKKESKEHKEQYKMMLYKYEYLLQLFPELKNYVDDFETIQQLENAKSLEGFKDDFDRVQFYLSKDEFKTLDLHQRNQLALDRYIAGQKTKWQIGRDYELFCGRQYELKGWTVEYSGMEQKLEDLGRDLIAQKNNVIHVIQCKYWSQSKVIHEKHITQLFGTTTALALDKNAFWEVKPIFMTNIQLSKTAKKFADKLNVEIVIQPLDKFPRIKCNISKDGSKIYHLPFDQQYDRTKIRDKGEFYAFTVQEAVDQGFRRAFKYYGT